MKITREKIVPLVLASLLLLVSLTAGGAFGYILSELHNMTGIENLKAFQPSIPTRLYDVNGELIAELFDEKRDLVFYEDLPKPVIHAFLAAEDKDFYDHFGINPMAIVRAMIKNIQASISVGEIVVVQGGSTITQQLSKRLFTEGERTLSRKIVEAIIALQIESRFSKEEILEMYFNQIYLGHGCHGIATAARFFFDKDVRHLNAAEASVLAALPSKPNGYSPLRYPRTAFEKNKDTVRRMKEAGFITDDQAERIFTEFWPRFVDSLRIEFPTKTALTKNVDRAPHFTDYIRQILISRFGEERVYNEGMQVYTTLDLKRQEYAEKSLKEGLIRQDEISTKANAYYRSALDRGLFGAYSTLRMIFNLPGVIIRNDLETKFKKLMVDDFNDSIDILALLTGVEGPGEAFQAFRDLTSTISTSMKVEGALIAVEPKTGYITSMVGGSEFQVSNQFNRAVQARRQPGSAFKPFVYGAALEAGKITTATNLPDVPIVDIDAQGDTWEPGNYEGDYRGMVPVYFALPASINIISVRIYDLVGPDVIIDYASRMLNVPVTRFNPNPTLALGTTEVTPIEMATAYSIYANSGRDVLPFAIRYIVDRDGNEILNQEEAVGRIIAQKELKNEIQVIPESVAWIMTDLMRGVIDRGTANDAIRNKGGFRKQAAGKTGTTSNWTDAWFCGFTPDLTSVVWVGYDRPFMSMGKHQAGASVAAPIWANYMKKVYNGMPDPSFSPPPSGVYSYGRGYGTRGARNQYYQTTDEEGNKLEMKTVLDRYLENEGLKTEE